MDFRFGFYITTFDREEFKAVDYDQFTNELAQDAVINYSRPVVMDDICVDIFTFNPVYQFFMDNKNEFFCDDNFVKAIISSYSPETNTDVYSVDAPVKATPQMATPQRDIIQRMPLSSTSKPVTGGYYELSYNQISLSAIYDILKHKQLTKSNIPNYITTDDSLMVRLRRNELIAKIRVISGITAVQNEYDTSMEMLRNMNVEDLRSYYETLERRYNTLKCQSLIENGLMLTNEVLDKLLPNGLTIKDKVINLKRLPSTIQQIMFAEGSIVNAAVQNTLNKYSIRIPDGLIVGTGLITAFAKGIDIEDKDKKLKEKDDTPKELVIVDVD